MNASETTPKAKVAREVIAIWRSHGRGLCDAVAKVRALHGPGQGHDLHVGQASGGFALAASRSLPASSTEGL